MANKGEGTIKIMSEQYDMFYNAMEIYCREGMSEIALRFLDNCLQGDQCNDLWLRIFSQALSEFLNLSDVGAHAAHDSKIVSEREKWERFL